jgi:hypothetical protein
MTAALSATDRVFVMGSITPSVTQSAKSPQHSRQWFTTANNDQRVARDVCAGQSHFSAPIGSRQRQPKALLVVRALLRRLISIVRRSPLIHA